MRTVFTPEKPTNPSADYEEVTPPASAPVTSSRGGREQTSEVLLAARARLDHLVGARCGPARSYQTSEV